MGFTTNQARQLYVVGSVSDSKLTDASSKGAIYAGYDSVGKNIYLQHVGEGGLTRADIVHVPQISYITAKDASTMRRDLKRVKVVLDSDVNSGAPVAGQEYILRLNVRNFVGISEEYDYDKYGSVVATSGLTASNFYKALALSCVMNLNKDINTFFKVYLEIGGTSATTEGTSVVEVTSSTGSSTLTGTYTGIIIEEVEQTWELGIFPLEPVNYQVFTNSITVDGSSFNWGDINTVTSVNSIGNGKDMADMEYFYHGERADIYRGMDFPVNIKTKYLVDSDLEYNTLDISYYFVGDNESAQKSEKAITLLFPKVGATNSVSNALINSFIAKLNAITGVDTITTLDTATT